MQRPLSVSERYFAFLDSVTPMNIAVAADLDACLPADFVAERWQAFVDVRCLPRLHVRGDLTLVDPRGAVDFGAWRCPAERWDHVVAQDSRAPFGLDRPMRCRYLASPDENRARLYLVVHHAVTDGRGAVAELQAFLRFLDSRPVAEQNQMPSPGRLLRSPSWQSDRRAFIEVLQAIRRRNEEAGPPQPSDWHQPRAFDREPRFQSLLLESELSAGLLARTKQEGARVHSATAAAWLCSVAQILTTGSQPTLQLATSVDLAEAPADPDAARSAVVGVIANRYRVDSAAPWRLARRIRAATTTALDAGEGELFFVLARVDSAADLETGARMAARALASAPPAVSVTNLGIVDATADPPWVHAVYGYLPAAPNQVVSAASIGYRGRLANTLMTADLQLAPAVADSLAAAFRERVHVMATR